MSEKKRKILEDWSCPACLETIGDGCVPAVMNGCTPFAHVACMSCLTQMTELKQALCPDSRAPFTSMRPLAAFVDRDDPQIADALAKKARVVTLGDRIAALGIADARLVRRLTYAAERFQNDCEKNLLTSTQPRVAWWNQVPEFDQDQVALSVARCRPIGLGIKNKAALTAYLKMITNSILPYMRTLFPTYGFYAGERKTHKYMCIEHYPK